MRVSQHPEKANKDLRKDKPFSVDQKGQEGKRAGMGNQGRRVMGRI